MASLSYSLYLMKLWLTFLLLLTLISCFLKQSHAVATASHFHTVEISSLLPSSICNPSTTKGSNVRQSAWDIHHRYGPCSQLGQDKATTAPSLSEVLSYDQSRVDSIQARLNPNSTTNKNKETFNSDANNLDDEKAQRPVQSGQLFHTGNYIVIIVIGTPRRTISLIIDTGSDLTWMQCEPCIVSCYKQQDPVFNPSSSSSYSNVSCNSEECSQLSVATGNTPGCTSNTCIYKIRYGDQSFSVGFFSKEKLTISTDEFPDFSFGCGQNNQGLFGDAAGVLGLGRNPPSIVSQTAKSYGDYFSYCLPSTSSSTGYLTLGKSRGVVSSNIKFTPFVTTHSTQYYFIDIIAISVGGRQLPVSQSVFLTAGTIIDSGTVITRLPPAAYRAMTAAFRTFMANYPRAPAFSILDTCYDLRGYRTVTIPTITFIFSGNVKVDLPSSGIIIVVGSGRVCLAFTGNEDAYDVAIFGSTQQKTFEVVYDVAGGSLGFGPGACN